MIKQLNKAGTKLFERVYAKHLSVIGNEEKEKYQKGKIVKIERDIPNKCLNVHLSITRTALGVEFYYRL